MRIFFVQLQKKYLYFSEWHIFKIDLSILSRGSIFVKRIYK